jgi:archaellum biogenesis protein FlaJ (TadC family)
MGFIIITTPLRALFALCFMSLFGGVIYYGKNAKHEINSEKRKKKKEKEKVVALVMTSITVHIYRDK